MQQQNLRLNDDQMNTLNTDTDFLMAAFQAIPKHKRRGNFNDYLKDPIRLKALQLHANAIKERMGND